MCSLNNAVNFIAKLDQIEEEAKVIFEQLDTESQTLYFEANKKFMELDHALNKVIVGGGKRTS